MLISHSFAPNSKKSSIKKANSLSRDKLFKTAKANTKLFKISGFPTGKEEPKKNKQSKIASTEATRSFQAEYEPLEQNGTKDK